MIGLVDRALTLNPSFARGWYVSGVLRLWAGEPDLAIEHVETSLRLSPRQRMGTPLFVLGMAYLFKRRFDEAAAKLLLSIQDDPGHTPSYRFLAACHAHMGRLGEARAIVAQLRAITPQIVPSVLPWRNPEDPAPVRGPRNVGRPPWPQRTGETAQLRYQNRPESHRNRNLGNFTFRDEFAVDSLLQRGVECEPDFPEPILRPMPAPTTATFQIFVMRALPPSPAQLEPVPSP